MCILSFFQRALHDFYEIAMRIDSNGYLLLIICKTQYTARPVNFNSDVVVRLDLHIQTPKFTNAIWKKLQNIFFFFIGNRNKIGTCFHNFFWNWVARLPVFEKRVPE